MIFLAINFTRFQTRKRYFMTVDVFQRNRVMLIYSVTASHSGPISINFLHNALLRYNGCEDCAIEMKTEPVLDPAEVRISSCMLRSFS